MQDDVHLRDNGAVQEFIRDCLAKNPQQRKSASDLLESRWLEEMKEVITNTNTDEEQWTRAFNSHLGWLLETMVGFFRT